jgi:hypothetical protein
VAATLAGSEVETPASNQEQGYEGRTDIALAMVIDLVLISWKRGTAGSAAPRRSGWCFCPKVKVSNVLRASRPAENQRDVRLCQPGVTA